MKAMSLEDDIFDFEMYLRKAEAEPDPKENSVIWADDPFYHGEEYHQRRKKKRPKPKSPKKKKH